MRTRGRPPLPKTKVKSITLCTRTDERTYRRFKRAAQTSGLQLTEWIRTRLQLAAEEDLAA